MEKNKGIFPFRKHPVGDFHDGKKGRKRKGGRLRQSMGFLMAAALIFNTLPASGFAVSASEQEKGLCEHHPEHTEECGYAEAQPCTHEHGEECYKTVTECVHTHTDECYPETEATEESMGEGSVTTSDAGNREPSLCTHVCSEESGCITKVLDCHHEHDENCGYQEAQDCGYVCEICNGTEPENTENNAENDTENAGTDTAECICETLCTEDSINGDCPVCGAEDADLSHCKGEKTEEQEKTGEKVITAWEWIDPEEYLTDGMLALPGAGRENPAFAEDVTALLPEKIQAKVAAVDVAEDGEETEEDAETAPETEDAEITLTGWKCASYPEDGAYEGTYTFTAFLPEGFVLAEDAAALEVEVELGGGEMLEGEVSADYQEASWNGSEVTYTGKTENCTSVESSTEAVTWNAGWYVVSGTVTISEPITVTGVVNLILADGCTLNAEKGIVVETGNSLTIYAQSVGTGTLNATGTDSAGIGGAGRTDYGVDGGSSGAITIHGGNITATSQNGAGIGGGAPWAGANGGSGSNITIYGGSVTAQSTGTMGGAGIGGGCGNNGGTGSNIQIYGGTINATGSEGGAGIGGGGAGIGGTSGAGTNITISGGIVTAVGGTNAAGIGGGGGYSTQYSSCTGGAGSVTISGGIVDAKGGAGNSSGNYAGAPIGNGGNTTAAATVNKTTGIVFENGAGTVCGDVTLDGSYTVPGDYTLNIPASASLSGSGTLSGGSAFTTENLTADMISVPTDLYYTGKDRTEDITTELSGELDKGVTICGQTFTVSGWTLAVEKTGDLIYTATYTNNNDSTKTFTKTITLLKSGTKFEGDVKTYNGDTQTTTFNADDTITVKATPTATGTAPQKAAARLRADPTAGQMALFVGDVQVSAPVEAGTDGTYTMEVSAAEVLLQGNAEQNGNAVTLTAKFVGNDNMADAAGTVDVRISAVAMAERDGEVIGYFGVSNFEGTNNLFCKEAYADATITLLGDVKPGTNSDAGTTCSTMVDITCTLDLAGHNFASTDTAIYVLPRGNLTIQDSSTGKTGNVSFIKSDGTLTLYGGTFGKIETAYTLASLLAENCAYYRGSTPILLSELEGQKTLDGTVTVQECQHTGVEVKDLGDGKHGLTCPYCGYHSEHTTTPTATASGNTVTLNGGCNTEGCGYTHTLGSIKFTFPKVTYGQTEQTVTLTGIPADCFIVYQVEGGMEFQNTDGDTEMSITLAQLFGSAKVTAGEHKMKVSFFNAANMRSNACELNFTVDPAPLTEDMVTLGQTDVTYNGTEQKPALSVKQGETTLTEGTDYEVSYTRDGVVTNDFTSAGTVKITATGKGNYTGTVTKEYAISKADVLAGNLAYTEPADLVYTGQPKTAVVTANNLTGIGEITVKYKKDNSGDLLAEVKEPGTYHVYADISAGQNYNAAQIEMGSFTISYMATPTVLYNGGEKKDWYNGDVDVSADSAGYTVSDAVDGDYKSPYHISAQEGTVAKTLYFMDTSGHISEGVDVEVNFDLTPPTGEIAVGAKWWQNILHFISFGNYAAKEYTVTIKAEDKNGSGISKIEYVIVTGSSQYTDADTLAKANLSWTEYNSGSKPTVPVSNSQYVAYARLTDNIGNVAYISTDGILLDSTAPTVDELAVPEETKKDVTAGFTFTVSEAADYYYVVLPQDSTAPSAGDIIVTCGGTLPDGRTGTAIADTVDSGKGAASGDTSPNSVSVEAKNLQPNTAYIVYVTAVDRAVDITNSAEGTPAGNIAAVSNAGFTTKKTLPVIAKAPVVTGTYGQSVGEMTITGGTAQVGNTVLTGTWTVSDTDKGRIPFAGTTEEVTVIFTPENDSYDSVLVQALLEVEQAEPDVGTVTAGTLEDTLDVGKVALSRTNQTPAGTLTLTESTLKYGTNTYTWKFTPDDTNYKPVTGKVQITVNDTIPPTAEYRIGTDGWKPFIHNVPSGLSFCKGGETVEIRGTDDTDTVAGSGISLTQYYISGQEITDTDSIAWNTYKEPASLNAPGTYLIYVKVTDHAGNTAVLSSEGIVAYAESALSPAAFDYTYKENHDCTVQLAMNGNTFRGLTDGEGNAIDTASYSIDGNDMLTLKAAYLDTLDQGGYTYTVSMNPQGIDTEQVTLAYTFTVNVKAKELTVTGAEAADRAYDGTDTVEITAVTLGGAAPEDEVTADLSGIHGTLSSANAGMYTEVTLPELTLTGADSGNYTLVQPAAAVPTSVTITPLDAVITVGTDTYHKTFGDAAFTLDVTDNNTEADVQYEVTKGTDVASVEKGIVAIRNAGTAEIRVFLPASTNYTAAENKTITVTVNKKSGYTIAALNRSYYYQDGGTDNIDLAALLPKDCGNVAYGEPAVSGDVSYSAAPAMSGGGLSYTLDSGKADDGGTITVTVATRNYEDIQVTVNVKLAGRISVSLKAGTEVTLKNNALTYGKPLSDLIFNEAEFVTADQKAVAGTLAWKEPAAVPAAGTAGAAWIFTPEEDKYEPVEGIAAIRVNKAPYAPGMPDSTMAVSDSIEKVGDIPLLEGWEWQAQDQDIALKDGEIVSAMAVYTGADKGNYETEAVMVAITRSACDHVAGDVLYTGVGEMAPTCTEPGLGHRECTICHTVVETDIAVEALGHSYISEVTKEPTASEDGEMTYTCSRCGSTYIETIPRETPDGLWISGLTKSVPYTGSAARQEGIRVYHGSTLLREKTEYTISYKNNTGAGTAQLIVTGRGNYKGKCTAEFTIEPVDLKKDPSVLATIATATETGKSLKPAVAVTWNSKKLKENKDYTLSYETGIKNASEEGYDVVISGKGNYTGDIERKFYVKPRGTKLLNKATVKGIKKSYEYQSSELNDGQDTNPEGQDAHPESQNAGPKGLASDLENITVKIGTTTLAKEDYTVRTENTDVVGTGYVVIEPAPTSIYAGEKRIPFNITGTNIRRCFITGLERSYPYTGEPIMPAIEVYTGRNGAGTLIPSDVYTVRYSNDTNQGKATVTVTGIPEKGYSGSITAVYRIGRLNLATEKAVGSITVTMPDDIKYAKGGAKPQPVITHSNNGTVRTLREGVDYTLKYSNNTAKYDSGTAAGSKKPTLKITGIGNYTGTIAENFDIVPQDIGKLEITAADKAYNSKKRGSYYYSVPKVYDFDGKLLKSGRDYTVQYTNETTGEPIGRTDTVENGTQIRVTVSAKENSSYVGTLGRIYSVRDAKDVKDISKVKNDKIAAQQYTGSAIKPEVKLYTLTGKTKNYLPEEDYEIIGYYNNIKRGNATVLIRGTGAYSGVKSITFKITSADNKLIWIGSF